MLLPVAVGIAANQVLNDGRWSLPWLGIAVALAVAGWPLAVLLGRLTAPAPNPADAKQELARLVDRQWRAEITRRFAGAPDPIPVRWRPVTDPKLADRAATPLEASSDQIEALAKDFRALPRRRMVILGEAGTGKTTLAVQLVRELLKTRADHPDEPVPVLLTASSWDTDRFPELAGWLAERLAADYSSLLNHGPDMPRSLVADGAVLPVLDGLDELPGPARGAVVRALNRSMNPDDQLIITSRRKEFTAAIRKGGTVLKATTVIEPEPLHRDAAAGYLARHLPAEPAPAWREVLAALTAKAEPRGPVAVLAKVCRTPLGLWLVRAAYADDHADPAPLLSRDVARDTGSMRAHLFDRLIDVLVVSRRPRKDDRGAPFLSRREYDPEKVRRWLRELADHLTHPRQADAGPRTRDLSWWQLARDLDPLSPVARLSIGAIVAVTAGIVLGGAATLAHGVTMGIEIGLIYGLLYGAAFAAAAGRWATSEPGVADLRLRGRVTTLIRHLLLGAGTGLSAGLAAGYATQGYAEVAGRLGIEVTPAAAGLAGLVIGVTAGLTFWLRAPSPEGRAVTPQVHWRGNRALTVVLALGTGLVGGVALVVLVGVSGRLFGGALLGLTAWFASGFRHRRGYAWAGYLVASHRLARRRGLPRDLMGFLDDAHRLGILRAVGPVYQFRHADLQEHFSGLRQASAK